MEEYENRVFLRGRIKTMFRHGKYSYADIEVNDTSRRTGVGVFHVLFSNSEEIRGFISGDRVNLEGRLIDHSLFIDGENENKGTGGMIIASHVEIANRLLHEYFTFETIPEVKGVYAEDRNDIYMIGDVESVEATKPSFARVTIEVKGKKAGKFTFIAFGIAMKTVKKCQPGDKIAIAGTYTSRDVGETERKKDRITLFSLVANDVYLFNGKKAPDEPYDE